MAVYSSILRPTQEAPTKVSPLASASSAESALDKNAIYYIVGTGDFHIKLGPTGVGAATVADWFIPAKVPITVEINEDINFVRVFNPTAATIDVYFKRLERF